MMCHGKYRVVILTFLYMEQRMSAQLFLFDWQEDDRPQCVCVCLCDHHGDFFCKIKDSSTSDHSKPEQERTNQEAVCGEKSPYSSRIKETALGF